MPGSSRAAATALAVGVTGGLGAAAFLAMPLARGLADPSLRGASAEAHAAAAREGMGSDRTGFGLAAFGLAAFAAAATARSAARCGADQLRVGARTGPAAVALRAFENELGVQAPVGFWDPLGLAAKGDAADFRRRRQTEIKHGRVAMWACIGFITPEFVQWPGYLSPSANVRFTDIPHGLAAISKVPAEGWLQMFLFVALLETEFFKQDDDRAPGDFKQAGALGVPNGSTMTAGPDKMRKLSAEMANGRLAMMAIIGMFFQNGLTGSAWGDWSLYDASPLRDGTTPSSWGPASLATTGTTTAPLATKVRQVGITGSDGAGLQRSLPGTTNRDGLILDPSGSFNVAYQVGITAPFGEPGVSYWDPAGLADGCTEAEFKNLRSAELKHGRVAMMATVGLVAQHYFTFKGAEWEAMPRGINAAVSTPGAGWFGVLFLLAAFVERKAGGYFNDTGKEPGNFGDPFEWLDAENSEAGQESIFIYNDRLRNYELNHCRLAMFGFIGTVLAEYHTGYDAIEQWDHLSDGKKDFLSHVTTPVA